MPRLQVYALATVTGWGARALSRLFISHSSKNDDWALALRDWLVREGWSGEDDIFLDLDPERGIAAGQRWARTLEDAATRCEAVLFVVSEEWLDSKWCVDEYQLASKLNKKLYALLIDDLIKLDRLPGGLTAQWQVVHLKGEPAERFLTIHPRTQRQSPVHLAEAGLTSLKRGLEKAGIGPETFELQKDPDGPFGWRAPYRGLEALEPEDAAVFFGRGADIVRGIDALRGLAARKPPRLLVILGASGAGKSSFLRAGLWPRLNRDDSQWLPLRAIRAGRGGAIEGNEGLLSALEEVHRRFALRISRAELRQRLASPKQFVALLRELREAAARRALQSKPPYPLPVLSLDQAEEIFSADAGLESEKLLRLARAAIDANEALLLACIRSDSYGLMQSAKELAGIDQVPLSLGPVPHGEIGVLIRAPSEILRRKAGALAPVFDVAVVERLQAEIEGETDALPLLAFVLQRLMREHVGKSTIGLAELEQTGGVAATLESEADAALADAGLGQDRARQREALRRLFIPRLARIDRNSKAPQRRIARQNELPADLVPLARALTERRLLVVKLAAQTDDGSEASTATVEVAHEALLRRWPTLADLLAEDRDALLLLDGVLLAAIDWGKANTDRKSDFLTHRGSRLSDALALAARGADWEREMAPARSYLAACQAREAAEREEKEAVLAREQQRLAEIAGAQEEIRTEQARTAAAQARTAQAQTRTEQLQRRAKWMLAAIAVVVVLGVGAGVWQYRTNIARQQQLDRAQADLSNEQAESKRRQAQLDRGQVNLLAELATAERLRGNLGSALRFGVHAARLDLRQDPVMASPARAALAAAVWQSSWRLSLGGHEGQVERAVFSPDGSRIVTASRDRSARIWDTATGKEIAVLRGHEGTVYSAAFSPDGKRIITASYDDTARIWDAATAMEIAALRGHEDTVWSAAFSPDGARIVTASSDRTARIWSAATAEEIAVLRGHEAGLRFAAFSPDGKRIVTGSSLTSRIWDAETGRETAVLKEDDGCPVFWATFSPDGTRIVTALGCQIAQIYHALTGERIAAVYGHDAYVSSATFSPDSKRILTASEDGTARVWDAATAKEIAVLRGHEAGLRFAAFSPDGKRIVTASRDRTARIWDAAPSNEIAALRHDENQIWSAAFSPDGKRIVTASSDRTARIWDAATAKEIALLRAHDDGTTSAVFSPDGARIAASGDETARIWDATSAKEIATLRGHESRVMSIAFSGDGSRIVTASWDGTARIWNAITAKEIAILRGHERGLMSAAFSPDGTRIVTASSDRTARIWDVVAAKEIAVLRGHEDTVWSASFSRDGSRIVTASSDDTARIWDAATAKEVAVLRGHDASIYWAAFSPDSARIVTASHDTTARVWDATTAQEIVVLRAHKYVVRSAAFSPDGALVVTASRDNTARIWDTATAMEIAILSGHTNWVNAAAFSPDGTRIVTASEDRTARVWGVHFSMMSMKDLLAEACTQRLPGLAKLTREEMRLAGYPDSTPEIDVCASTE